MLANLNARTFLREMKPPSRPSQTFSSHTRTEDILGSRSFDSAGTQVIASSSSAKNDILELDDGVKYFRHGSESSHLTTPRPARR
ncbi:hypothetical protein HETIRDRAFT_450918 [Heterobasidion irregulare TC 32-1]|uniref:Uncharacterized protein n=1 Tax=Heterobasidion irregulare (strain TC 32-1) TaxID=747525 RepID=W4KDC5_HETIT|nr:uncharacterized protein HETIRDRAFT_450918 [Heterobasidion irregulare TC 32-1]ETW83310.1 hypothetical protein HETIRDRAFT_450918 [Heterobasidion irregulare TC 32-1]